MRNSILASLSMLLLSGCAAEHEYEWSKPRENQQEFARDKYACVQEARSPTLSAYEFMLCMEAKGYSLTEAQTSPAAQETRMKIRAFASRSQACIGAIRNKPQYAVLVPHLSDLESGAFSVGQLTDKSLATPAEAQMMGAYTDEVNSSCSSQFGASVKAILPALGLPIEQVRMTNVSLAVLLVERKITWGEYARRSKQSREEYASQANQILSASGGRPGSAR